MSQPELYERFRALHEAPGAFVMPNPWDGGSALLMKQAGLQALGSTSFAIAIALGRSDGAHAVSRAEAVANAALLTRLTGLPVNGDLEDGFGASPADCVATVEAAIAAGLAGLGIEDTTANPESPIHDFDMAVARMRAAAGAAKGRILLTGGPTISSMAAPISMTRSGGWSPLPRSARTCSTRPACPISMRSAPSPRRSRPGRSTC